MNISEYLVAYFLKQAETELFYVVSVDSATSSGIRAFANKYPNRFIEIGVMEQTAVNFACGLASQRVRVFVIGIATFITYRSFEQIRTILDYGKMNVCLIGMWCGLYYSHEGHSHTCIEDLGLFTSLKNTVTFSPADRVDMHEALEYVFSRLGPVYIRIENPKNNRICDYYLEDKKGSGDIETIIISTGESVYRCIEASKNFERVLVIKLNCLHPFDMSNYDDIIKSAKHIITVEEHHAHGGLFSLVSNYLVGRGMSNKIYQALYVKEYPLINSNYEAELNRQAVSVSAIIQSIKGTFKKENVENEAAIWG